MIACPEDVRVAVILIAVRDHRIVQRIGTGGLGGGSRGFEGRRAECWIKLAADREHAVHRRAQRGAVVAFCDFPTGLKRWYSTAARAWPAARILTSAPAPANKRDNMEMTSNPGALAAGKRMKTRWMRWEAIQRHALARRSDSIRRLCGSL
jgi:hypothetical protein